MKTTAPARAQLQFPRGHVEPLIRHANGNRAARRLLSLFRATRNVGQLEAVESFRPQWLGLIQSRPGEAESLAHSLVIVSNRPLGVRCSGRGYTVNSWMYPNYALSQSCKPL